MPTRDRFAAPPSADGAVPVEAPVTVDDVIATQVLFARTSRPANYRAENEALSALVEVMSQPPEAVLQKLADTAMALCEAGSAGISIAEMDGESEIFRWRATAGNYSGYLGGTMPRHFSPCGAVLERDAPLLMIEMVRYYDYVSALSSPPYEVLLVPFHSQGKAVGTLWVVAHDDKRQFDKEDLRILQSLTNFASMAVQAFARTHELEQANAKAKAAGELREHFIAILGHDLRNPLAAISQGAQLLERGMPPERLGPIAGMISKSARRIGELADSLLDFTRGRLGGGISITRTRSEGLASALSHVVAELHGAHPDRSIQTRFAFNAPVSVDTDRMAQMVSNLLGNALTHGDAAQPIRIEGKCDDKVLVISVANGGAPIPPEAIARLFKPFERGEKTGNGEGLGLGLYIASEIARAHGGELKVTSDEAETIFRFMMPQT